MTARCRYLPSGAWPYEGRKSPTGAPRPRGCRNPRTHAVVTYRGTLTDERCETHAHVTAEELRVHGLDPVVLSLDDPELQTTMAALAVRAFLEEQ